MTKSQIALILSLVASIAGNIAQTLEPEPACPEVVVESPADAEPVE